MKKLSFICIVCLCATTQTNAQLRDTTLNISTHKVDANLLLQKSKNKKKVAWIMAGGGATLILSGIIIPKGEVINDDPLIPPYQREYKNDGIKGAFYFFGTLSMLGSIPFFISSHHNKKKAVSLSLKNESVPQVYKSSIVYQNIPSLTLKFKF